MCINQDNENREFEANLNLLKRHQFGPNQFGHICFLNIKTTYVTSVF